MSQRTNSGTEHAQLTSLNEERNRFLEILGLSAFAIAQPVLDVMGRSPETFVFRGAGTADILLLAMGIALLPAAGLFLLSVWTRLVGPRVRTGTHAAILVVLASVVCIQVLKKVSQLRDVPLATAALVAGVIAAFLFTRSRVARTWLRYAAVAPVAFVGLFVLVAPVSKLVLPAAQAGAASRTADPVPVVMLVFDQLPLASLVDPSGKIDPTLFPNFADLASRSNWYRNYTVTEPFTHQSVPTMLTGKNITDRSRQPLASDYPNNLFTMLRESHRLVVHERVTQLCPPSDCSSSGDERASTGGLGALARDALTVWTDLTRPGDVSRDVTAQFVEQEAREDSSEQSESPGLGAQGPGTVTLRSLTKSKQPTLYYFHLMLPHIPWRLYPSGAEYQRLKGRIKDDLPLFTRQKPWSWVADEWPVLLARQRHLLQLQYLDGLVGEVVQRLHEIGLFDKSLLVLTSDHGISFQPGMARAPVQENMHEVYWVPLILKQPHQRQGEIDDRNVRAIDLLPTIADVLGTEVPWEVDGASMLDPDTDAGPIKEIFRGQDDRVPWPEETLIIAQSAAQRRMRAEAFARVLPCTRQLICPYRLGPGARLIGGSLDGMTVGEPSGWAARLELPHTLDVKDPETDLLPGLVWGALTGGTGSMPARVAVAVNGRVAGVSDTWSQDEVPGWFGALVPDFFIRLGGNDFRLFEVRGTVLHPIALE